MTDRSRMRLVVLQVLVLALMATLLGRLWYLQVVAGPQFQAAAEDNRVREVIEPTVRGLILDSSGRPLVQNRTTLVLTLDRTVLGKQKDDGKAVIARLAQRLRTTPQALTERITLCGTPGAAKPPVCWNGSPYQPIPVAKDVPDAVALQILERREDFPGVGADLEAVREYPTPFGANAAHLLGYLGPAQEQEIADSKGGQRPLYASDLVGRGGLEETYDEYLRGADGVKQLLVDRSGNVTGTAGEKAPVPGDYLVTNIDARVQAAAEKALYERIIAARKGQTFKGKHVADSGAVVVMDVRTGAVVAMASYPSYDPSIWVGGISKRQYDQLADPRSDYPLVSRAFQGGYPPASTFKVVSTSAAALAGESLSAAYPCTSSFQLGDRSFANFESRGYGNISVARAIEVSCNTVFYRLGYDAWVRDGGINPKGKPKEYFVSTAKRFGYGSRTGVDLPGESSGQVVSRSDKRAAWEENRVVWCSRGKNGYPEVSDRARAAYLQAIASENCVDGWQYRSGDAVNFAIGQGDTLVTPLQVARVYSAIANGGTLLQPQIAKAVVAADGTVVKRFAPKAVGRLPDSPATLAYLQSALRGVATAGTASGIFKTYPIPVSAKTGSGQVLGKKDDISWFASFAPSTKPRFAVVMMITQGGTGAGTSGPGVQQIYDQLFGVKGQTVDPKASILPNAQLPTRLPAVGKDGVVRPVPGARIPPSSPPAVAADRPRAVWRPPS